MTQRHYVCNQYFRSVVRGVLKLLSRVSDRFIHIKQRPVKQENLALRYDFFVRKLIRTWSILYFSIQFFNDIINVGTFILFMYCFIFLGGRFGTVVKDTLNTFL